MNETAFVDRRQADWNRLGFLCDKAERSVRSLSADEFEEFVDLYRRSSSDLATVRTRSKNLQLAEFLNDLVGRAYATLYREPRGSILSSIATGVKLAAQTVRRRRWFVLASASLFFGSSIFAFFIMNAVPATQDFFMPASQGELVKQWSKPFDARSSSESELMTGFYLSNNPRTAIIAGAVSACTFGVGTAYLLFENGAMLGALANKLQPYHMTGHLLIWVSPHGVPELSGVILSGAAGFLLAWALINPGRRKRGQALRDSGKDIIVLLTTGALMMFIAAPIEGFFSFNPNVPDWAKLTVAGVSLSAWLVFWSNFGKEEPTKTAAR